MSAKKHIISNLITKLAIYPISFISSVVVARILGPEDRGVYAYLLLIVSFVIPIFSLGVGGGITYMVSSKKYSPKESGFSAFTIGLTLGVLLSFILYLGWYLKILGITGNNLSFFELVILLISLIFSATYFMISRILFGDSKFIEMNWITILQGLLNPIFLITFVWILALGINGAAISLLLINFVTVVYGVYYFFRFYHPTLSLNPNFMSESFKYGFKGWFGDMAIRANVRLDQVILASVASSAILGIYSIAVLLVELLWILPDSLGPILFNKLAAEDDIEKKLEITYKINRLLLSLTFVFSIFLTLGTFFIIIPYGYGDKYVTALIPFLVLIPGTIFYVVTKVITKILSGSGLIGVSSKVIVSGSLISILLYFLLIPRYGMIGAALASSLGYITISFFSLYYFKRYIKQSIFPFFNFCKADFIWAYQMIRKK
ncbi:MAG TPA: oligosaccharide flippase family protein [Saprospiraceae bacterium]|nr:oligosaccharide flippase family protein [Saprospiraceae bacterium]